MMNAFKYFLTAMSDIKQAKTSGDPSLYELEKITFEFDAIVEAGPKPPFKTRKVFIYGNPPEQLRSVVHSSVVGKKQFSLMLMPQSDGTFVVCP